MLAAAPAPQHHQPALTPVLDVVRALAERPSVHDLAITKGDLRLSVHRRGGGTADG